MQQVDVLIIGGGIAGSTLALQIQQVNPRCSILLVEKRMAEHADTAFKVGESSSEIGSSYLMNTLGLDSYLEKEHLVKLGTRFFLSTSDKQDLSNRVELGPEIARAQRTYHMDKGKMEKDLLLKAHNQGVDVRHQSKVSDIQILPDFHKVVISKGDKTYGIQCKWLIDASGRNSLLKRSLGLKEEIDHHINSVWFRVNADINIDDWSQDDKWKEREGFGIRALSTNHLIGKGYWVWIIPLASNCTSIGIVADPAFHAFNDIHSFEKAFNWLKTNEPQAASAIEMHKEEIMDFKVMKDFSSNSKQFYSDQRWALTGDAAAFLDPLYSPGLDFIALNNTWITDLVSRSLNNENIELRTKIYETTHRQLMDGWLLIFKNSYAMFGNAQLMLAKIVWDWGTYWSIPNVLFANNGYTDLEVIKQFASSSDKLGNRFSLLNEKMQSFFYKWNQLDKDPSSAYDYYNIFSLKTLEDFQLNLHLKYSKTELLEKINQNLSLLEEIAAQIMSKVFVRIHGQSAHFKIDPYNMELSDDLETLASKSLSMKVIPVSQQVQKDIDTIWFSHKEEVMSA